MENETTETATETKAAPGAAKAAVSDKAPATTAEKPEAVQTEDPKEIARRAFQEREARREKKASEELAETRKELEAIKAQLKKPETKEPPKSFLEDPEGALKRTKDEAKAEVLAEIQKEQEVHQAKTQYRQHSEKAAEFLLTRSHLKEDKSLLEDVAKRIEKDYRHIAAFGEQSDPMAAARLAYIDACVAKGITPDMDGFKSAGFDATKGRAGATVKPSAAGQGKRTFAPGEAEKYVMSAKKGSPEFKRRLVEIEEAKQEGRIQS